MFDCHVHSTFSTDSILTVDDACKRAVALGLEGMIFTDHLDYDYPGTDDFSNIDFNEYLQYIDGRKEIHANELKLLKGIEVGIQPHVMEKSLAVVKSHDFDYVLASVHILDGMDPYYGVYYENKSKIEAYNGYLEKILIMIKDFSDFDMVGHLEYIIRYAEYDDKALRYNDHKEILDEIFKLLIQNGKGFEINTGSFREKTGIRTADYDYALLKRYSELGGDLICLGSDAHSIEFIGCKFDYFRDMLLDTGFKYVVYYEKRKPVYIPL